MTGKGGATSAPPAINHQEEGPGRCVRRESENGQNPACGVHGSNHEGLTIRVARLVEHWAALVAGQDDAEGRTTSQSRGSWWPTMNPFMTADGFIRGKGLNLPIPEDDQKKFVRRIVCPVLYMRTNQPNQRPPNHNQYVRQPDRSVTFSPSFAWWGGHFGLLASTERFTRSRLPSFASVSLLCRQCSVSPTEVRRQNESP